MRPTQAQTPALDQRAADRVADQRAAKANACRMNARAHGLTTQWGRTYTAEAMQWDEASRRARFGDLSPFTLEPVTLAAFTVTGGEGELTVCAASGAILDRTEDAYPTFTRIDVAEWRAFYPGEELAGQSVDILDTAGWEGESYSPAELDFRVELAFTKEDGAFLPAERFRSVEVCGWVEADGVIEAIPGQPASAAHGFGVYGREAEGDPLAVHLFDMASPTSALTLATEYAGALPVRNLVGEG